jgi:transmembrane sensor
MSTPRLSNCPYSDVQRLEAAQWFLDISEVEDPSPEMLQNWLSWLGESEGNRLAFESIETIWHCVPAQLTAAVALTAPVSNGPNDDDGYDTSISVVEWRRQRTAQQANRPRRWPSRLRSRRSAAAAAIVAVTITTSWFVAQQPWFRSRPASSDFATRTGEHMQITLADGSRVTLGARSRLTVGFTSGERAVWLQTGEAFFTVHKDSVRPFKVHALDGVITAVGTAFNVRATEAEVTVAVEEGVVNITDARHSASDHSDPAAAGPLSKVVNLRSGEQLAFVDRDHASGLESVKVSRIDPAQPARWRDGWLVYRDEPLRYVIADVARYTDSQIIGGDSIPDNLHFTGAVFKDSVVEWVKALPQVFPIDIQPTELGFRVVTITPPITSAAR